MAERKSDLQLVRKLMLKLPGVEEGLSYGVPAWKTAGTLLACTPINKSAEPNSLVVKIAPAERVRLIAQSPETYYVTDHYQSYPLVLVRLSQINRSALEVLLHRAWDFVSKGVERMERKSRRTTSRSRAADKDAGPRAKSRKRK